MRRRQRTGKGFTLIETLVAVAVAAVVLGGFYSALSTGGLLGKRADTLAAKYLVATGILDRVGVDLPLRPGTLETGTAQGLAWDLRIAEVPPQDMQLGPIFPGELVFVSVSVTDPAATGAAPVVLRAIRYRERPL